MKLEKNNNIISFNKDDFYDKVNLNVSNSLSLEYDENVNEKKDLLKGQKRKEL